MAIRLINIHKSFGTARALSGVNTVIEDGKTSVLIGPSGSGKSTLIKIITGLLPCDSGSVHIGEEKLSSDNLQSVRRKIGYVIQSGGLFPHLTAERNISLLARHTGVKTDKIESRIQFLSNLTKFPVELLNRYPAELSGGQRQRVGLMRALMPDPEILLLDEPLGSLDPLIRYDLQSDLKTIFKSLNKTVLLVTHDMNEAAFFGDVIIIMKEGTIVQEGSTYDLVNKPADPFVTKFINSQRSILEQFRRED